MAYYATNQHLKQISNDLSSGILEAIGVWSQECPCLWVLTTAAAFQSEDARVQIFEALLPHMHPSFLEILRLLLPLLLFLLLLLDWFIFLFTTERSYGVLRILSGLPEPKMIVCHPLEADFWIGINSELSRWDFLFFLGLLTEYWLKNSLLLCLFLLLPFQVSSFFLTFCFDSTL